MVLCRGLRFCDALFETSRASSEKCRLMDALNCSTCLNKRGRFFIYLSRLSIFLSRITRSKRSRPSMSFRARSRWPRATKPKRLRTFCTIPSASSIRVDIFFAVPVPVNLGGLNDVDLQAAQTREDQIEFIGVGNPFR